jgi:hypothetical protein
MESLLNSFQRFVTDLTTVEKRQINALTELARDALKTHPELAVSLASVLTTRILQVCSVQGLILFIFDAVLKHFFSPVIIVNFLQASADLKLPPLYLLDSISKNIGEPYKTYFAESLPDVRSILKKYKSNVSPALPLQNKYFNQPFFFFPNSDLCKRVGCRCTWTSPPFRKAIKHLDRRISSACPRRSPSKDGGNSSACTCTCTCTSSKQYKWRLSSDKCNSNRTSWIWVLWSSSTSSSSSPANAA